MTPSAPLSPISRDVQSTPGVLPLVPGVVNGVADTLSLPPPRPLTVPTTLTSLTVPLPDHNSLTLQPPPVVSTLVSDVASAASQGSSIILQVVSEGKSVLSLSSGSPLVPTILPTHTLTLQAPPVVSTLVSDMASAASQGSSIISQVVSEGKSVLSLSSGSPLVPTILPTLTVPLPDHPSLTLQAPPVVSTLVSDVASAASQGSSIISQIVSEGNSVLESAGSSLASDLSNGLPTFLPLTPTIPLTQLPSLSLSISPLSSLSLPISPLPSPPLSSFQLPSALPQPTSLISSLSLPSLSPSLPSGSLTLSLPLPLPPPSSSLPLPSTGLSPSVISTESSLPFSALPPITGQNSTGPTINIPSSSSLISHSPTNSPTINSLLPISSPFMDIPPSTQLNSSSAFPSASLPATPTSIGPSSPNPLPSISTTPNEPSVSPSANVPPSSPSVEPHFPTIIPGSTSGILAHSSANDQPTTLTPSLQSTTLGSMLDTTLDSTASAPTSIFGSNHPSATGPQGAHGPNATSTPVHTSTQNGSSDTVSTAFLQQPAKVAGVFTAVGVVVIAAAVGILILTRLRRKPRRGSHRIPNFDPDEERQEEGSGDMRERSLQTTTRRSGISGQSTQPSFEDIRPEDPFATMSNPLISNYQGLDTSETARSSWNMVPTHGLPTSPVDPVDPYGWPVTVADRESPRPTVSPDPYSTDPDIRAAMGWILADEQTLESIPEYEDEDSPLTLGYGTRPVTVTTAPGSQASRMQS